MNKTIAIIRDSYDYTTHAIMITQNNERYLSSWDVQLIIEYDNDNQIVNCYNPNDK